MPLKAYIVRKVVRDTVEEAKGFDRGYLRYPG
jgi:hypothetical protein